MRPTVWNWQAGARLAESTTTRNNNRDMKPPTVETWDSRTLSHEQALAIGELLVQVWPKPNVTAEDRAQQQLAFGRDYEGPDAQAPRSYVVLQDGRVVGHSLIFARTVRTMAGELTIAALARVCSDPNLRGQGLGEAVVRAAFGAVDLGDFPFSYYQTSHKVRPFYEKLGAILAENPVINSLASGPKTNPFWDEVTMRYPAHGNWPAGTIDLRGPGY
jgi:predicted N-acetyltransferase YhbS